MGKTRAIHLVREPVGMPDYEKDFAIVEEDVPALVEGSVLFKTQFISVDPYLRSLMTLDLKGYQTPFKLNAPLWSGMVCLVEESKNDGYKAGDLVYAVLSWREKNVVTDFSNVLIRKLNMMPGVSPSYALGVMGMPGMTALLGLEEIGNPQSGETLVVSGAAGAVGSLVGQLGKIFGLRVVGIAGGKEKTDYLKNKLGFDAVIDYKSTPDIKAALAEACPKGVDIYYDNVGGKISDAVFDLMNRFGRIICCGAISLYNDKDTHVGPRDDRAFIKNSLRKQGFLVNQWSDKFPAALVKMAGFLGEGKLKVDETVREGFENTPKAFVELMTGANIGKMVVKC